MKFLTVFTAGFLFYVQLSSTQDYGDLCKTTLGENGMCTPSSDCAMKDLDPDACGYSGLVCCNSYHTIKTNVYDQGSKSNNRKTDQDFDISSDSITLSTEDHLASGESNHEFENRFRWPVMRPPTFYPINTLRHSFYGFFKDQVNHRQNSNPSYIKPSIYRPNFNKPTENSVLYHRSTPNSDAGDFNKWHPRPLLSRPVWDLESPKETEATGARRKRISQIKCEEYSLPVTEIVRAIPLSIDADIVPVTVQKCDFTAAKLIVGGVAAEVGEFPHMAAVGFRANDGSIMWNCGGSLISERYVMTAGHCTNTTFGNPVVVRLGEHNLVRNNDDARPEDYRITQVIPHPRYKTSIKYNDIALLRLESPVRLTNRIRPACLLSSESFTNKPIATGWGRTDFVGRVSEVLMKVGLSIIDNNQCNELYKRDRANTRFFQQGITESMLCAGELQGGKDTCFGDSGGPLQIVKEENRCLYHIIGITSFGKVCGAANSPGVYTRVSSFLPWIENVVWG